MHTHLIPIHNPGESTMYVGALAIPAGETRHIDKLLVPPHLWPDQPAAEPEPQVDYIAELSQGTVAEIKAALPQLDDASLERLGELEQAKGEGARRTALEAIANELLDRADKRQDGQPALIEQDVATIIAALPELGTADLVTLLEAELDKGDACRADLIDALTAERNRRETAAQG